MQGKEGFSSNLNLEVKSLSDEVLYCLVFCLWWKNNVFEKHRRNIITAGSPSLGVLLLLHEKWLLSRFIVRVKCSMKFSPIL